MPGPPVNAPVTLGWFGKLPCAGDFVYRRLPYPVIDAVDHWLRQGLSQLRSAQPDKWQEAYFAAPVWNCAVPATVTSSGMTLVGLIAPSRDRVGREFPICAGIALPADVSAAPLLSESHDWLAGLGRLVVDAQLRPTSVEAFDAAMQSIALPPLAPLGLPSDGGGDILSIINSASEDVPTVPMPLAHALPWPELPLQFDAAAQTSYWWTNTAAGAALRGFTSDAGLAPSLLLTLMRPQPGAPRRRQ